MAAPKGNDFSEGRPKGSVNKSTKEARAIFTDIMAGQMDNVNNSLESLRVVSHKDYLAALSKLMPFFMPKMVDVTSEGRKLGLDLAKEQYKDDEDK